MSQNKKIISKLQNLIELRERTIIANKRSMKDYLVEYKKSLELDKELKKEQKTIMNAIDLIKHATALEQLFMDTQKNEHLLSFMDAEASEHALKAKNNAPNRDPDIVMGDEE